MIKLGYKASAEQFGPSELLEFSVLAERRGMDSVWISDHFQPWRHTGGHAPFSLAWLGALGARTGTIVMGTSVLTPTYRYHPSIVAQAFATLGTLFPGRVVLGTRHRRILERGPRHRASIGPSRRSAPRASAKRCGSSIRSGPRSA